MAKVTNLKAKYGKLNRLILKCVKNMNSSTIINLNKIILWIESEVRRMKALKKRKVRKAIARRAKDLGKYQVNKAWRNIFVQAGIIK